VRAKSPSSRSTRRGLDLETGFVHLCRLQDGKVIWGYDGAGPPRSFWAGFTPLRLG
jgi:hypothetical protein